MKIRTLVVSALLLLITPEAFAQNETPPDISDWEVLYDLYVGQKVKVVRADTTKVKGRLVAVYEDAITVRRKKEETEIARDEVFQVLERGKFNRGKNTLIGAGLGASIGALLPIAAADELDCNCTGHVDVSGEAIGVAALVGSIVGALVEVSRSPRYYVVYESWAQSERWTGPGDWPEKNKEKDEKEDMDPENP